MQRFCIPEATCGIRDAQCEISLTITFKMDIVLKYFSDFSDTQLEQFRKLDELYKDWNEKINVISRKDMDGLYEKHVLHSLSIAAIHDFKSGSQVIDLGTGGVFPAYHLLYIFRKFNFILLIVSERK